MMWAVGVCLQLIRQMISEEISHVYELEYRDNVLSDPIKKKQCYAEEKLDYCSGLQLHLQIVDIL